MKTWVDKLRQHVAKWNRSLPKEMAHYVYRFDPIDNVAKILNTGELLSRAECAKREITYSDCASPEIIANTTETHKTFVRLYFFPRTPMQFNTEGIRRINNYSLLRAHCPVPVFMMFDFVDLIAQDQTQFSTGNMASSGVEFGSTEALFDKIPFEFVYHRGSTSNHASPRSTTFHRHAEILVPARLSVEGIKRIVCRSHPERRTLLHMLRPDVRARFASLVQVQAGDFFERTWAFVEKVEPLNAALAFTFNPPSLPPTVLDVRFRYEDGAHIWTWKGPWDLQKSLSLDLSRAQPVGTAALWLEGHLAFKDRVNLSESPI